MNAITAINLNPTGNKDDYEKHIVLSHDGKLAYPSKVDLERNNLKPQGRCGKSKNKEQITKFFASDNGQVEEHTLEESICRPLIGQQSYKPFFLLLQRDPKIEFLSLKNLESYHAQKSTKT